MQVTFLGFGLIGGSVAMALRRSDSMGEARLVAWSPSGSGPRDAAADGILDADAASVSDAVVGADLVVLAAPPLACLALLDDLRGPAGAALTTDVVITDVASTKAVILERARSLGLPFVGGHPMAGRETSGFGAASADLFVDRPWAIVPGDGDPQRVREMAVACGAVPIEMDAIAHDEAVAGTSHAPLVLAAALAEAVVGGATGGGVEAMMTAGGWRDMTRLVRGDVTMGAGILATNGPAVVARIRAIQAVLEAWLQDLERVDGVDPDRVEARLADARDRLTSWDR